MRKIYIDADYKCHVSNDGTMVPVDTEFFDGKCEMFVEGHMFLPTGESWIRDDGEVFYGEMVWPWKPYAELDAAQREYEKNLLAEYTEALKTLGVGV